MITRYRKRRKFYFVLLLVCVCIMSVGFAAFSSELNISSSALVRPDSSAFKIVFSSSGTEYLADKVNASVDGDAKGGSASIDNTGTSPTISDLTATFTEPGQSVKYEFYVYNIGAYDAYLTDVNFKNVDGKSASKVCTSIDSSSVTNSLMQSACNDINISLDVGTATSILGSTNDFSGHNLNKGVYEKVVITITYSNNDNRSDGDFRVEFGDIGLTYSTVDAATSSSLISFTIDGIAYQAESGMTWGEWINSSYNTDSYYLSETLCGEYFVVHDGGELLYDGTVWSDDLIVVGGSYHLDDNWNTNIFC